VSYDIDDGNDVDDDDDELIGIKCSDTIVLRTHSSTVYSYFKNSPATNTTLSPDRKL